MEAPITPCNIRAYRAIRIGGERMKKERGAISVEACTILLIFLFGMLAMLGLINVVRGQVIVQNVLNQTAKELSQYSYIASRIGYLDYIQKTKENADALDERIDQYKDMDKLQENLEGLMKEFQKDGGQSLGEELVGEIFGAFSTKVTGAVNNTAIQELAKTSFKGYAKSLDSDGGDYFARLGIVNGITGVTDGMTIHYCLDNKNEIVICVDYKLNYKFPFIDIAFDRPIHLCAVTKAWAGGEEK